MKKTGSSRSAESSVPTVLFAGFGLILILGGVARGVLSQSVTSLAAGAATGSIMLFSAYLISTSPKSRLTGLRIAIAVLLLLTLVMGYRFTLAFKFFPAGMVTLLSAGLLVYAVVLLNKLE